VVCAAGWVATRQQVERLEVRGGAATGTVAGRAPAPSLSDSHLAALEAENRRLGEAARAREAGERKAREEAESLREQLARAETAAGAPAAGAQVNTYIADLLPPGGDVVRGPTGAGTLFEIPRNAGGVTFVLTLGETGHSRDHAVELRDAGGKVVWSARGLVEMDGTLTFHLGRRELPPGTYTLDLYGLSGDRREKLETYTFTIA